MLIRFSDDYIDEINAALALQGRIQALLCKKEPFMGKSPYLDKMYRYSILLAGIVDHLMYDDNSTPEDNEALLMCLRTLINKNLCGPWAAPTIDVRDYHISQPVENINPAEGIAFDQGVNQYNP